MLRYLVNPKGRHEITRKATQPEDVAERFTIAARRRGLHGLRATNEAGTLRIEYGGTYVAHVDPPAAQWIIERFPLYGAGQVPSSYLREVVIGTFAAYEQGLAEGPPLHDFRWET